MATYATIFSDRVGLFAIDSNIEPFPDLERWAKNKARTLDTRTKYAVYSCTARNMENPGSCPVEEDLPQCVASGLNIIRDDCDGCYSKEVVEQMDTFLNVLFQFPEEAEEICEYANDRNAKKFMKIIKNLQKILKKEKDDSGINSMGDPRSQPTPSEEEDGDVFGNPTYWLYISAVAMVNAQDYFSAQFDEDYFANRTYQLKCSFSSLLQLLTTLVCISSTGVVEIANEFTSFGTGAAVELFFNMWAPGYYWPKGSPQPPMG